MGNNKTKQINLVILRDSKQYPSDYFKLFQWRDHIKVISYDDFDQFISKQSLKNLQYILIIQGNQKKDENIKINYQHIFNINILKDYKNKNDRNFNSTISTLNIWESQNKQIVQRQLPFYCECMIKSLSHTQQIQSNSLSNRQKIINYIRRYSLQYLHVYIYNSQFHFIQFPEQQLDYITLISNSIQKIIRHILNQKKQSMALMKFKRLIKDRYKRKLAIIVSKDYKKVQRVDGEENIYQVYKIQNQLIKRKLTYTIVNSINQLRSSLLEVYPQFLICTDEELMMELIQLKSLINIDFKIIFFGKQYHLKKNTQFNYHNNNMTQNNLQNNPTFEKKMKQIWWIPNTLKQIGYVLSNYKLQQQQYKLSDTQTKNIIIYVKRLQNILNMKYIISQIQQKSKTKKQIQKHLKFITYQFRIDSLLNKIRQSQFSILILFDSSHQQVQRMKLLLFMQYQCESRLQMIEINSQLSLDQKIEEITKLQNFQYKCDVIPLDTINCVNLQEIYHFIQNKMGFTLNKIQAKNNKYRNQTKNNINNNEVKNTQINNEAQKIQKYFPQVIKEHQYKDKNTSLQSQSSLSKLSLSVRFQNTFQYSYIICTLQDYENQIFPYLTYLTYYNIQFNKKLNTQQNKLLKYNECKYECQFIFDEKNNQQLLCFKKIQNYLKKIKIIIYEQFKQGQDDKRLLNRWKKMHSDQNLINNQKQNKQYNFKKYVRKLIYRWCKKQIEKINKKLDSKIQQIEKSLQKQTKQLKQLIQKETKQQICLQNQRQKRQMKIKQLLKQLKQLKQHKQLEYQKQPGSKLQQLQKQLQKETQQLQQLIQKQTKQNISPGQHQRQRKQKKIKQLKQLKQKEQKQTQIYKIVKKIQDSVFKRIITTDMQLTADKPYELPGIVFAHYRLHEIEQYLQSCKCVKLNSDSSTSKKLLQQFSSKNQKIQNILQPRSILLNSTFVSKDQIVQKLFLEKQIVLNNFHQMQFIKFSQSKSHQIHHFEQYIRQYAHLWKSKINFIQDLKNQSQDKIRKKTNLQLLKQDIQKTFYKCKSYGLLKISTHQFQHFYIDKINNCETLLDLQIAIIYIYSLPHGIPEILNIIFHDPVRSYMSIQLFRSFILILFLNFYSFEGTSVGKSSLVIYVQDQKFETFYNSIKKSQIIYNRNILHCLSNDNSVQNNRNNCIYIQHQNNPLNEQSSIEVLIQIQRFAFYKQSAEYLIAPFTKFRLQKLERNGKFFNIYLEIIQEWDQSNIFLKEMFIKVNNIKETNLINQLNNQKKIKRNQKNNKSNEKDNSKSQKQNKSLSRMAQQSLLVSQKRTIKNSLKIGFKYSLFIQNVIQKQKYLTARQQFQQMNLLLQNQLSENNDKLYQKLRVQFQLQKLKIQKSFLYFRMSQYSKAINQLQLLSDALILTSDTQQNLLDELNIFKKLNNKQNIQEVIKDQWLFKKVQSMKKQYDMYFQSRKSQIEKIKPEIQWEIQMDEDYLNQSNKNDQPSEQQKNIVQNSQTPSAQQDNSSKINCTISKFIKKWKVQYSQLKQTFIMKQESYIYQETLEYPFRQYTLNLKNTNKESLFFLQNQYDVFNQQIIEGDRKQKRQFLQALIQMNKNRNNKLEISQDNKNKSQGYINYKQFIYVTALLSQISNMKDKAEFKKNKISNYQQIRSFCIKYLRNNDSKSKNNQQTKEQLLELKKKIQSEVTNKQKDKNQKKEKKANNKAINLLQYSINTLQHKLKQYDKQTINMQTVRQQIQQQKQQASISPVKQRHEQKSRKKQFINLLNKFRQQSKLVSSTRKMTIQPQITQIKSKQQQNIDIICIIYRSPIKRQQDQQKLFLSTYKNSSSIIQPKRQLTWLEKNLQINYNKKLSWHIFQFNQKLTIVNKNKRYKVPMKHQSNIWFKDF